MASDLQSLGQFGNRELSAHLLDQGIPLGCGPSERMPRAAMGIVKASFGFSSFSGLSLRAVFVCFFGRVSSSSGSFDLALLQSAIRTRLISVPGDNSKS